MARIVGIDLGTTNSLIAYMKDKTPTVIPDGDGHALVPSIVAYTPEDLWLRRRREGAAHAPASRAHRLSR